MALRPHLTRPLTTRPSVPSRGVLPPVGTPRGVGHKEFIVGHLLCLTCSRALSSIKIKRHAKYCDGVCWRNRNQPRSDFFKSGLCSGTIGTISEMVVCQDLLRRGMSVYRSISPNSPFDVVADNGKTTMKVEIRTGVLKIDGTPCWPKKISNELNRPTHFAVVVHKIGKIFYIPDIDKEAPDA